MDFWMRQFLGLCRFVWKHAFGLQEEHHQAVGTCISEITCGRVIYGMQVNILGMLRDKSEDVVRRYIGNQKTSHMV